MENHKLRISLLFVEDEEGARKSISEIVGRRVTDFFVAANAGEAIEIYKKHKPDLVLSDIQMPGIDGLQMVEKIKQINPQVKLIMMTAFADTNYLLRSINLQVDGYIVKPVRKDKLLSTIKKQADIIFLEKKTKKQEQELIISEQKFRELADLLPQVIYEADTKGNITYVNKQGFATFGYSPDALKKGFNVLTTLLPDDIPRAKQNMYKILSGGPVEDREYVAKRKDGSHFPISMYSRAIIKNNKPVGMRGIIVDITDQKMAEEAIRQQNLQLLERNEELDAFSHTVAHDLKNPLSTILGFAEVLLDGHSKLSAAKIHEYIGLIIKSCNKTYQIINNLLLFASIRESEVQAKALCMGDIVAGSLNGLAPIIKKTGAKINVPQTWPVALGHGPWIEEVWTNYLSNAIKYGGSPPLIEMGIDTDKLENVPKGMVRFWIKDNGPGISADNQKLLFRKFERLDQVRIEGHGLGLSVVSRIIKKLGGQVGVESGPGQGSRFYFTLPYSPKPPKRSKRHEVSPYGPGRETQNLKPTTSNLIPKAPIAIGVGTETSNLKILIADDEEYVDMHLSILLNDISNEILHAKTGRETIELCRNNPDIDLVLMDIKMPDIDGYEATRQIREFNKDVIIIAQTAYALTGDREKALGAGCNDYLSKPIKKGILMGEIDKHFKL
ncbi:MAG: hypothetical protein B6D64_08035 [Bacteroidetes bacterium 4484_276]|nr:MAG: hypothetical protein B6D64_08035 [Bacteroidetes bacterium 4484_276]